MGVIGIPVAIGLTMAATTPGEFRFVRGCFIVAATLTLGSFIWLTHEQQLGIGKLILVGAIGAIVTIGLVIALDWVKRKQLSAQPKDATVQLPGKIEICSKSGAPYEVSVIIGGRTKSTVAIGIRNSGGTAISNCKVYIEKIAPPPLYVLQGPILLDERGFSLHPFDPEKLVDVAVYWEHLGQYRFLEPPNGVLFAEGLTLIDVDIRRSIVVKVVATECTRSAMFNIWLDESRKLRLQFVGDAA